MIITSEINSPIRQQLSDAEQTWTEPQQLIAETSSAVMQYDYHSFNFRLQALKGQLRKKVKH